MSKNESEKYLKKNHFYVSDEEVPSNRATKQKDSQESMNSAACAEDIVEISYDSKDALVFEPMEPIKSERNQIESESGSETLSDTSFDDIFQNNETIDPVKILRRAFTHTQAVGSATATVAVQLGNQLKIANLGDSGFLQIRFQKVTEQVKTEDHFEERVFEQAFCI